MAKFDCKKTHKRSAKIGKNINISYCVWAVITCSSGSGLKIYDCSISNNKQRTCNLSHWRSFNDHISSIYGNGLRWTGWHIGKINPTLNCTAFSTTAQCRCLAEFNPMSIFLFSHRNNTSLPTQWTIMAMPTSPSPPLIGCSTSPITYWIFMTCWSVTSSAASSNPASSSSSGDGRLHDW